MDWDMMIGSGCPDEFPVDLVIRNQPETDQPETTVLTNRRRIVHRIANNLDGLDPSCGNCCILQ